MTGFVHLRVRSEFSLQDSIVRIPALVSATAAAEMPAVAMADLMNLYGLVKFYKAAQKKAIKPIFGADLVIRQGDAVSLVTALVLNNTGYLNLMALISQAYITGQEQGRPVLAYADLSARHEGLIFLLSRSSDVGQALIGSDIAQADRLLSAWMALCPSRVYMELQRTGRDGEEDHLHAAMALAERLQCPVVATNDVRFLTPEEFEAHEVRVSIAQSYTLDDPRRPRDYSAEQYFKTTEQMQALFSDIPEALANTVEIAKRCSLSLSLGKNYLPDFPVPPGLTMAEYFSQLSHEGLQKRLDKLFDRTREDMPSIEAEYKARLEFELNIINQMGFPGYFLIVMDFIRWAKENGVPVGPGRGSGAGSLVAYSLLITDLDPIKYDLLFERFLNPERVSMPDFDIDFCMEGRDRVIDYVANHYGRHAVSQIITFGTMAAKAVVRDVARVLGKAYGLADRISKMIPFTPGISLEEARQQEPMLEELLSVAEMSDHDDALEIWEMALKLEGITRGVGKHAGGVLIAPGKLTDFTAVYTDDEGKWVSQYDKDDVESVGLVKFDFLGLRTLTIIDWALKDINAKRARRGEAAIDIDRIPLNDPVPYRTMSEGKTTAIFQLESRGMKELIKKLKPSRFEDVVALVALYRPGPLESGMVDDFINRKHGRADVAYPHPELEPVLENTYGVILYQEQVMQIAQVLAGYSLGGADMLRRAMGKKKPEEMAKERVKFMEGSGARGVDPAQAGGIFDLMEKFAGYGFNKSHSAAYALVSYQTAWLKVNYPAEFMAAVLSSEMANTDKIVVFIEECRAMGLSIRPPSVNESAYRFVANDAGEVIYGLGAIRGVGEGPVASLLAAREADGEFQDLFDFTRRIDLRKLNKRALEALIRAGALDAQGAHRAVLMASLENAVAAAEQQARNDDCGMVDLFGDVVEAAPSGEWAEAMEWSEDERLQAEKETLGLYLTGHPIDQYEAELGRLVTCRLADLQPTRRGQNTTVAGLLMGHRIMKGARGSRAFLTIDDRTARVEVTVFNEVLEHVRPLLSTDSVLVIEGEVSMDEYVGALKVVAKHIQPLVDARTRLSKGLELTVPVALGLRGVHDLTEWLMTQRSDDGALLRFRVQHPAAQATFMGGEQWRVKLTDPLLRGLRQRLGHDSVRILY
ncbi:DNA polymerase III alpha subunit [Paraperlucidibaca baekdonensis]|uniref:DNA polymerase III subunit alpha n=1 Tax=Paraperlucidibaca baekdonensis TaxID=748120 RepID=A0A3E0H5X1_9GAMM|nr:DNA polymerase III subunit alpha [Paraperlucidibaca baekdonensis]REH37902.1 DNA polymerase III alpha subunit [Paraperlucidibaca baekdonensis]